MSLSRSHWYAVGVVGSCLWVGPVLWMLGSADLAPLPPLFVYAFAWMCTGLLPWFVAQAIPLPDHHAPFVPICDEGRRDGDRWLRDANDEIYWVADSFRRPGWAEVVIKAEMDGFDTMLRQPAAPLPLFRWMVTAWILHGLGTTAYCLTFLGDTGLFGILIFGVIITMMTFSMSWTALLPYVGMSFLTTGSGTMQRVELQGRRLAVDGKPVLAQSIGMVTYERAGGELILQTESTPVVLRGPAPELLWIRQRLMELPDLGDSMHIPQDLTRMTS